MLRVFRNVSIDVCIQLALVVHQVSCVESKLILTLIKLLFGTHEKFLFFRFPYAYTPSVMLTCFAYSSSGTPNLLAIATCDGVSLTVLFLRPVEAERLAEATF